MFGSEAVGTSLTRMVLAAFGGGAGIRWLEPFFGMQSSIQSDQLCVLAVVNLKRRPMYWVGRE